MNFGEKWIGWIEECISTVRLSILVNGSPTVEFNMERGIRQGDPISPSLFLLIAEALHLLLAKAEEYGFFHGFPFAAGEFTISHLQFADDTVIFLEAKEADLCYLGLVLRTFEHCSGLKINLSKSCMYSWEDSGELRNLADDFGCEFGSFPFTYLGMSLGTPPNRVVTWEPVMKKVQSRLSLYKARYLSLAGRVVLINSVVSALPTYYMSIYKVPKGVVNKIDSYRRRFLWGSGEGRIKIAKVCWNVVCKPKRLGGLGICDLQARNKALLAKWWWRYAKDDKSLWRKIVIAKYGANKISWIPCTRNTHGMSKVWRDIISIGEEESTMDLVGENGCRWCLGNGRRILFWHDRWCSDSPLKSLFPRLFRLVRNKFAVVADFVVDNMIYIDEESLGLSRSLLERELQFVISIAEIVKSAVVSMQKEDSIVWEYDKFGFFSVNKFTSLLCDQAAGLVGINWKKFWAAKVPPKVQTFLWLMLYGRVPTKAFLIERCIPLSHANSLCPWCKNVLEDLNHLFLHCDFVCDIWYSFMNWWGISWTLPNNILNFLMWLLEDDLYPGCKDLWFTAWSACMWSIWLARNQVVFENKPVSGESLLFLIKLRSLEWCKAISKFDSKEQRFSRWWKDPKGCLQSNPILNADRARAWNPPEEGWLKCNSDGAVCLRSGKAGGGGVLRNSDGKIVGMFSHSFELCDANVAEVQAIKLGLELYVSTSYVHSHGLIMESDSQVALNWIQNKSPRPWRHWNLFMEIDHLVECISKLSWSKIYREANGLADNLAKSGVGISVNHQSWW